MQGLEMHETVKDRKDCCLPVTVPWTTVPFLSSMVTLSLLSFIRNLPARDVRVELISYTGRRDCAIGGTNKLTERASWWARLQEP